MNKKGILLILSILTCSFGNAQVNDTLIYKSGMVKVVDIIEYNDIKIHFNHKNSKDKLVKSVVSTGKIKQFIIYDENDVLVYNSRTTDAQLSDHDMAYKYPDTVSVSKHQLSINPFALAVLSLNTRYTYTFGKKMMFSSISRFTIGSLLLSNTDPWGGLWVGTGLKVTPYYGKKFSFGMDITPLFGFNASSVNPIVMIPLSADFDVFFNERIGLAMDFGFGPRFRDGVEELVVRGHVGVIIQFKDKKTFATKYR